LCIVILGAGIAFSGKKAVSVPAWVGAYAQHRHAGVRRRFGIVTGHFAIVTEDFGIVTGDFGNHPKSVTFRRNGWSRSFEIAGHVPPKSSVTLVRNTHLRIKAFLGTSENAVKTQIWIAIATYVLIAITKKRLQLPHSLYEIRKRSASGVIEVA
jgi:hypothetical protein